ncbi:MAG: DUF2723 domain-containing protein [Anaerolineae bacterium]|nr:DUF2723 domain-containing protein [Anaerolineae bacterium]MDW8103019.1 DUF2723 domain-containing protein [Anaerolineae bacterium]
MPTLVLTAIYLFTMPHSITWAHWGADGGDLATAIACRRLPHPPGFPTYLLLGATFMRLPLGDPAWRLNLLSALSAAGAAGLTAAAVHRISFSVIAPVTASLSLGLAPLFWSQALITEVYGPAAFFSAVLLFQAINQTPAWISGAVWGIGIGVHPTLLFLAPLVVRRDREPFIRTALYSTIPALVVAGFLYGPVLLAWGRRPSPWADFSNLSGWWTYVSGQLYHGYIFGLPGVLWPRRFLAWAGLVARQFTPVGALMALWGLRYLWRYHRCLALATALAFGALSLYSIGYNTADSLVYLVPALPLVALWLGAGLDYLLCKCRRRIPYSPLTFCLLLLPALQGVLFWNQMDISRDCSAITWALDTLYAAPSDAILLTAQDGATFALWYVRDALRKRPDVWIVDWDLMSHAPYRRLLSAELGIDLSGNPEEILKNLKRPVIAVQAP